MAKQSQVISTSEAATRPRKTVPVLTFSEGQRYKKLNVSVYAINDAWLTEKARELKTSKSAVINELMTFARLNAVR